MVSNLLLALFLCSSWRLMIVVSQCNYQTRGEGAVAEVKISVPGENFLQDRPRSFEGTRRWASDDLRSLSNREYL